MMYTFVKYSGSTLHYTLYLILQCTVHYTITHFTCYTRPQCTILYHTILYYNTDQYYGVHQTVPYTYFTIIITLLHYAVQNAVLYCAALHSTVVSSPFTILFFVVVWYITLVTLLCDAILHIVLQRTGDITIYQRVLHICIVQQSIRYSIEKQSSSTAECTVRCTLQCQFGLVVTSGLVSCMLM